MQDASGAKPDFGAPLRRGPDERVRSVPDMPPRPEDSFRDYVHARVAALSRSAYLLTGDAHLAEDLVQQTLVQVASRWERIIERG